MNQDVAEKIDPVVPKELSTAKTIDNLSKDLNSSFPYMVHFAKEYPDFAIGQQVVAQIPWGHNILGRKNLVCK